jgi:hypothetical protein
LFVGEPKSLPSELLLEHTVLLDEIIDDHLLLAVKSACQGDDKEVERLYSVYHCTNRLSVIIFDNNIIWFVRIFAPYGIRRSGAADIYPGPENLTEPTHHDYQENPSGRHRCGEVGG